MPAKCKACGKITQGDDFCESCKVQRDYFKLKGENRTLPLKIKFIEKAYSSYFYDGSPRQAIIKAKFHNPARFIHTLLTDISIDIKDILSQNSIDMVISSPYHGKKLYSVEFDLPQEMAKCISKAFNIPYAQPIEKVKTTKKQHELSAEERKVNLLGAFKVTGEVKRKNILIIDDVITTASTISALAIELKLAGAGDVFAWSYTYNEYKKGEKNGEQQ